MSHKECVYVCSDWLCFGLNHLQLTFPVKPLFMMTLKSFAPLSKVSANRMLYLQYVQGVCVAAVCGWRILNSMPNKSPWAAVKGQKTGGPTHTSTRCSRVLGGMAELRHSYRGLTVISRRSECWGSVNRNKPSASFGPDWTDSSLPVT